MEVSVLALDSKMRFLDAYRTNLSAGFSGFLPDVAELLGEIDSLPEASLYMVTVGRFSGRRIILLSPLPGTFCGRNRHAGYCPGKCLIRLSEVLHAP